MKNNDQTCIRVGQLKFFKDIKEISEAEEAFLREKLKFSDLQIECIKYEMDNIRKEDTFNTFDIKGVIDFWANR